MCLCALYPRPPITQHSTAVCRFCLAHAHVRRAAEGGPSSPHHDAGMFSYLCARSMVLRTWSSTVFPVVSCSHRAVCLLLQQEEWSAQGQRQERISSCLIGPGRSLQHTRPCAQQRRPDGRGTARGLQVHPQAVPAAQQDRHRPHHWYARMCACMPCPACMYCRSCITMHPPHVLGLTPVQRVWW